MQVDRLLEEQAEMEELNRKSARPVGEQRVIGAELDLSPFLVIDLLHDLRRRTRGTDIGRARHVAGAGLEAVIGERHGLGEAQGLRSLGAETGGGREARSRRCRALEQGAAINRIRHDNPFEGRGGGCLEHFPYIWNYPPAMIEAMFAVGSPGPYTDTVPRFRGA